MSVLSACMCVYHMYAKERKALNALRLELQTFVSHDVCAGNGIQIL